MEKHEVELNVGGIAYRLDYSINSLCDMEERLGKGYGAITTELTNPATMRISLVREILYSGLRKHHPEITPAKAGELMLASGGAVSVIEKIGDAMSAAFAPASLT